MSRNALAVLIALSLLAARCGPPDEPDGDEGCPAACDRLAALGCPEGAPTSDGVSCVELCQGEDMGAQYRLQCVVELDACDLASCEVCQ
jgi:hypothetical protein